MRALSVGRYRYAKWRARDISSRVGKSKGFVSDVPSGNCARKCAILKLLHPWVVSIGAASPSGACRPFVPWLTLRTRLFACVSVQCRSILPYANMLFLAYRGARPLRSRMAGSGTSGSPPPPKLRRHHQFQVSLPFRQKIYSSVRIAPRSAGTCEISCNPFLREYTCRVPATNNEA